MEKILAALWEALGSTTSFAAWDLGSLLRNSTSQIKVWGGYFIVLIGVALVIFSIYKIALGFFGGSQQRPEWVKWFIAFLFGGALAVGGWSLASTVSQGGYKTLHDLGSGGSGPGFINVLDYVHMFF